MTRWQQLKYMWCSFWRAYHRAVVRPALVRIDPITLLTIVGILGTAWNMGVATGIRGDADSAVQQLLSAPDQFRGQLNQQLADEQIDPFTYNARMEQVDRLAGVLAQYAALYDQRGDEIFEPLMLNGIRDAVLSLSPGEAAGKSLSGISSLQAGKGIDALITLQGTVEGVEGGYGDMYRSWKQNPFADLDRQLQTQIDAVMGADLEPFFAARMRGKVNEMKNIYFDLLRQYPNDSDEAARQYNAVLNQRAERYANVLMLAGEGRHWASVDEFRDWLDGLVQEAVLAEGPEADLFADDSWEDEPDEPPADEDIPDDAFEEDAAQSASALPDITVTGGEMPGDASVELFHRDIDFYDAGVPAAICEQALAVLPEYHLHEAAAGSYHPGGPTLLCVFQREQDQAELRVAITYMRNVETATSQWERFRANTAPSSCLSDPVELRTSDRVILHCLKEKATSDDKYYETRLLLRYRNAELELWEQMLLPDASSYISDLAVWGKEVVDEHLTLP